jgi:hypothetical protein
MAAKAAIHASFELAANEKGRRITHPAASFCAKNV